MTNSALIIDNDIRLTSKIMHALEDELDYTCTVINDLDHTDGYDNIGPFSVYIIRHCQQNIELINHLTDDDRMVIVLTNRDDEKTREEIIKYAATDYLVINSNSKINVIIHTVRRIMENKNFNIMIVDDSKVILNTLTILLDSQNLNHTRFSDGAQAWKYLQDPKSDKVDLIISDYEMPNMNGYELVKRVRTKFNMEDLPVLILSGTENLNMIAKFLKAGANDYIPKPFINEEFIARISNTLSVLSLFRKIKDMATKDFLTGLYNRAYLFDVGEQMIKLAKRNKQDISLCMIDIDNFKSFNDTYGHEVGDRALKHLSSNLEDSTRESDICIRHGGEEFVLVLANCSHEEAMKIMTNICKKVEASKIILDDKKELTLTISAGVTTKLDTLDNMLIVADEYMYYAKNNGKNQAYSKE